MLWKECDMKILVAMLGGTISSYHETGGIDLSSLFDFSSFRMPLPATEMPKDFSVIKLGSSSFVKEFLISSFPEHSFVFPEFATYSSENATPEVFREALNRIIIEAKKSDYDGILITHGTDTCAFFAQLAARVLSTLGIPFVITGSILVPDLYPQEAEGNLSFAVQKLKEGRSGVVFSNKRETPQIYRAHLIMSPDADGYFSEYSNKTNRAKFKPGDCSGFLSKDILPKILVIPSVPGSVIPDKGFDRVLICCNHSGTASTDLEPLVREWSSRGIDCYMAPVPIMGGIYESRKRLTDAGAIELPGMPIEGAWAEVLLR